MGNRSHPAWISAIVASVLALSTAAGQAAAHVDYVTDAGEAGRGVAFVLGVLAKPLNAALLGAGGVGVLAAAALYLRYRPARRDVTEFRRAMADYRDLLPWLLRLAIGLPLVGAGFAGYFFSPAVPPFLPVVLAPSRLFQVAVGFAILFGLATRFAAVVALLAYLAGLVTTPDLLLASEYVPGLLALVLLGSGRPSADHVLHRVASAEDTLYGEVDPVQRFADRFNRAVEPYEPYVATVVRVGLGLNFAFLGLTQKLLSPGPALAVVEKYGLTAVVPVDPGLWVVGAGLAEVALGLALLVGLFTRASAVVALGMFVLTLFGLPDDPVLAHVTLFGLASFVLVTGAGPYALDGWIADRFGRVAAGSGSRETGVAGD